MGIIDHILEQFGVDWTHFLAQVSLFLITYFLLNRFAFKPVLQLLAERRRLIEESQLNAEQAKNRLAEANMQYQTIIRHANEKAQSVLDEVSAASKAQAQRELQETRQEAELMITRAIATIAHERARMIMEVQEQMGSLVIQTTAKVIDRVLTDEDQKRLSDEVTRIVAN